MPNVYKSQLISELQARFGPMKKLEGSLSLFSVGDREVRIYVRYSRVHDGNKAFFGLREIDLRRLEGHDSYICLIVDDAAAPVFVPYADFEEVFRQAETALDGQYKVQLLRTNREVELYVARQGRFNVDAFIGFSTIEDSIKGKPILPPEPLTHSDVQTLLGAIGVMKGYGVWIPAADCAKLRWSLTDEFKPIPCPPKGYDQVAHILSEIDVIWVTRGSNNIEGLFEVEHSTSVYSGLLRFNDLLLTNPQLSHFSIVSEDRRRVVFARQLRRPTFQRSGLSELTSFLDYGNVYQWHSRLAEKNTSRTKAIKGGG